MNVPQWWLILSGVLFGLSILLIVMLIVVALYLVSMIRDLSVSIKSLAMHADNIGKRVETLVVQVQGLSDSVGKRANSIAASVDTVSAGVARKVDLVATAFLVLTALGRIGKSLRR